LAVLTWNGLHAQGDSYSEDEVKAVFLYHFSTYVQWPAATELDDTIVIAVLGANGIVEQLEGHLPGKTVNGRRVAVRRIENIDELTNEAVLFIGREENSRLAELLNDIRSRSILTITDAPNGLDLGATINFRLIDQRVRFEISLNAARQAGLNLSSRLLAAAQRVEPAQ
jgi:hypothetical protein